MAIKNEISVVSVAAQACYAGFHAKLQLQIFVFSRYSCSTLLTLQLMSHYFDILIPNYLFLFDR